ncbi:hypothetical protein MMC20_006467 [Loxospora ochrophaea]|nr:hypothetical protein [Loxospora ochrophaea]
MPPPHLFHTPTRLLTPFLRRSPPPRRFTTFLPHRPSPLLPRRSLLRPTRRSLAQQSTTSTSPTPPTSLSQRLRALSREYGWSALGVYLLLSALDFPFCFVAVRWLGTERIGRWEAQVMGYVWSAVRWGRGALGLENQAPIEGKQTEEYAVVVDEADVHGVGEAERANKGEGASIWTQLALAYAIHKSFIFVRVPLTAAVLPKVVKVLRGWGWSIGKRKPKA